METFDRFIKTYGLHDCVCNSLTAEKKEIRFDLESGLWELLPNGKEDHLTQPCMISFVLDAIGSQEIDQFIIINQILYGKISEIEYDKFVQVVRDNKFEIENYYFSPFNNTILLCGYSDSARYEVHISNIKTISVCNKTLRQ